MFKESEKPSLTAMMLIGSLMRRSAVVTPFSKSGVIQRELSTIVSQLKHHVGLVKTEVGAWSEGSPPPLQSMGFAKDDLEDLLKRASHAIEELAFSGGVSHLASLQLAMKGCSAAISKIPDPTEGESKFAKHMHVRGGKLNAMSKEVEKAPLAPQRSMLMCTPRFVCPGLSSPYCCLPCHPFVDCFLVLSSVAQRSRVVPKPCSTFATDSGSR